MLYEECGGEEGAICWSVGTLYWETVYYLYEGLLYNLPTFLTPTVAIPLPGLLFRQMIFMNKI